jgi:dTDP-4-amino-4,6-dideoxygalactose transaminase
MIRFLDLAAQYSTIEKEINNAIASVIKEAAFVGGRHVEKFETAFADYQATRHCIGVGNGTDALELIIEALDMPPGEIIVPANSFIASAEAVSRTGHRVVFCDVDPRTYCLSVEDARRRITDRTVALMPVHLYGHPCDMEAVLDLAAEYDLRVIEDCAQAHGARFDGVPVGGFGDAGAFSFYPGKNLGAYGDAGAVVTNDATLANRVRRIANHGRVEKYSHDIEGRNSRLDGLQAAILNVKLGHLDAWTEQRRLLARTYLAELSGIDGLVLPIEDPRVVHVYHLFVVRSSHRESLREHLRCAGIATGMHYPTALPKLAAYRYLGAADVEMFANRTDSMLLSLPIGDHMRESDAGIVAGEILAFFHREPVAAHP